MWFLRFRYFVLGWMRVPASFLFLIWLAMQLFGGMLQVVGQTGVSFIGHLGGVVSGFCLWLCWKGR